MSPERSIKLSGRAAFLDLRRITLGVPARGPLHREGAVSLSSTETGPVAEHLASRRAVLGNASNGIARHVTDALGLTARRGTPIHGRVTTRQNSAQNGRKAMKAA